MKKDYLGNSTLESSSLVLGGNVFGWTVNEQDSLKLLDAAFDLGINTFDTADAYSIWASGNSGGESEAIIGKWLSRNSHRRSEVKIITKVGAELSPQQQGLSKRRILQAVDDSLLRLRTDYIDLYFSHYPDASTAHEETLEAYGALIACGKVRSIGASNYTLDDLQTAKTSADRHALPHYASLQVEYNLYDRHAFEQQLRSFAQAEDCEVLTYFSLASGFLSGKYKGLNDLIHSARREDLEKYFDERGMRILCVLHQVAQERQVSPAEIALAWVMHQPGITSAIASATNLVQLNSLARSTQLELDAQTLERLDLASLL
ncbi:aldo/keto reductase [Pseudomonas frederiksbergensis]|nr:aldo/keto reductase [Pseudomonas frederiksbergensis]